MPSIVTPTPTTPPAPAAKYRPPTPAVALVPRDRLITALRADRSRRLTLIQAPSGFGKSTLAAQWLDVLSDEGIEVAWLTVDEDDDNLVWFLSHLIEAIRRIRPTLAEDLGQVLAAHVDEAARYVLTALIDRIDASAGHVALVIDDWHRVSDDESVAALAFLLENAGERLRVIVTSRSRSGLPLGRLRVRDELVVIDATALRFDATESRSLLVDVGRLHLAGAQVEALAATTDGWVAALQLAALSLRGGTDPAQLIGHLSGHDDIGEFLAANVLDALEPELLEFLLLTSITERTCGSLASALAGVRRGQAMLEQVEARGLFLQRVGADRTWFRYHHLFRDYLRARLERDRADEVDRLHRVASDWFAEHDMLNEAVDHALAAGDPDRAVELVEQDETDLLERGEMTTLLGIVAKLPQRLAVARGRIQLVSAWANALLQRPAATGTAMTRFHTALERSDLPDSERADLRAEADVLRSVGEVFADRLDRRRRPHRRRAQPAGVAAHPRRRGRGERRDDRGDPPVRLSQPRCAGRSSPRPTTPGWARTSRSTATASPASRTGNSSTCPPRRTRSTRPSSSREPSLGPYSHAARLAGALLGELRYETGELEEAARLLDESDQLGTAGGGVDFMIARYVIGARAQASARRPGGRGAAADRRAAGRCGPRPAPARGADHQRADPAGIDTELVDTEHVRRPRSIPRDSGIATTIAEIEEDSAIRLLLTDSSDGDREAACARAAGTRRGHRRHPAPARRAARDAAARRMPGHAAPRRGGPDHAGPGRRPLRRAGPASPAGRRRSAGRATAGPVSRR